MSATLKKIIALLAILVEVALPATSLAASLKYAAWLPFWKKSPGAQEIALQLEKFSEISPFSYEVYSDGSLKDSLKMNDGFWSDWIKAVKDSGTKIIPTIAILDGSQIYSLLSNKTRRTKHIANIVKLVRDNKYDGIDIDYEDKSVKTGPYFSAFLKELWKKLPWGKTLSCTIEARTPPSSQFTKIPDNLQYANDYSVINKYCDEVRIMAYDQQTIDLKLDAQKGAHNFYTPIADKNWVEKVIKQTVKTINRKKIMLGIPTYGYEYEVTWVDGITTYKRLRSRTFTQAMDLADNVDKIPQRNSAGELSFVYASSTPIDVSPGLIYQITSTTAPMEMIPAPQTTRYVSFSDSQSALGIINLAKKYGLKGVAFFKMDGETDPAIWDEIK